MYSKCVFKKWIDCACLSVWLSVYSTVFVCCWVLLWSFWAPTNNYLNLRKKNSNKINEKHSDDLINSTQGDEREKKCSRPYNETCICTEKGNKFVLHAIATVDTVILFRAAVWYFCDFPSSSNLENWQCSMLIWFEWNGYVEKENSGTNGKKGGENKNKHTHSNTNKTCTKWRKKNVTNHCEHSC